MLKNKYFWVTAAIVLVVFGSVFGFWRWHVNKDKVQRGGLTLLENGDSQSSDSTGNSLALTNGSNLTVSGGSSTNLGQLNSKPNDKATGSNSSSGSSSTIDPNTFAQYEQYKNAQNGLFGDIVKGDGAEFIAGKTGTLNYKGWLTNGKLFDASRPNSDGSIQPFVVKLGANQVIPGFEQGLAGMKVGGTRLIIVPPVVGYGANEKENIPANSVLIFEVKLLSVQ